MVITTRTRRCWQAGILRSTNNLYTSATGAEKGIYDVLSEQNAVWGPLSSHLNTQDEQDWTDTIQTRTWCTKLMLELNCEEGSSTSESKDRSLAQLLYVYILLIEQGRDWPKRWFTCNGVVKIYLWHLKHRFYIESDLDHEWFANNIVYSGFGHRITASRWEIHF